MYQNAYDTKHNNLTKFVSKYTMTNAQQKDIHEYRMQTLLQNDNNYYDPRIGDITSYNQTSSSTIVPTSIINDSFSYNAPKGVGSIKLALSLTRNASNNFDKNVLSYSIRDIHPTYLNLNNSIKMKPLPFILPRIQYESSTTADYYFNKEIYVKIEEIIPQHNFNTENGGFNYAYKCQIVDLDSIAIMCYPPLTDFIFPSPLSNVDTITLLFYRKNPRGQYSQIPLLKPKIAVTAIAGTNPAQFRVENSDTTFHIHGCIDATYPYNALTSQVISFSSFNSPNTTLNTLVTRENGYAVDTLYPNATTFTVPGLDLSLLIDDVLTEAIIVKNNQDIEIEFITNIYNNNQLTGIV